MQVVVPAVLVPICIEEDDRLGCVCSHCVAAIAVILKNPKPVVWRVYTDWTFEFERATEPFSALVLLAHSEFAPKGVNLQRP